MSLEEIHEIYIFGGLWNICVKVCKMQIIIVDPYLLFSHVVSSAILEDVKVLVTLSKKIQPNHFPWVDTLVAC